MSRGGVKSVSYSSYTINNAVDYPLLGLNLYGKSVQDGVPTPEAPVDIVSVGDGGSVEVKACGKNLVDPGKITIGGFDLDTGAELNSSTRARTEYIAVTPAYLVGSVPNGYSIMSIYHYTSKKEYLGIGNASLLNGKNGFIRLLFKRNDNAVITDDDLNALKNTIIVTNGESVEYEPYKANTANITSALPLCGIPVSDGGNYTDSNGQQWVCDELIYNADGTGKVVKRTAAVTINDNTRANFMANAGNYQRATIPCAVEDGGNVIAPKDDVAICSAYRYDTGFRFAPTSSSIDKYAGCFAPVNGGAHNINIRFATKATTSEQFVAENLGVKVIYQRETPKEIELTAAEMSALSQLQTYGGVTNIFNSGGTDMDVKFCTNKMLSECAAPITTGLQKQIDELKAAVLSLGGNI